MEHQSRNWRAMEFNELVHWATACPYIYYIFLTYIICIATPCTSLITRCDCQYTLHQWDVICITAMFLPTLHVTHNFLEFLAMVMLRQTLGLNFTSSLHFLKVKPMHAPWHQSKHVESLTFQHGNIDMQWYDSVIIRATIELTMQD